MLGDFSIKLKNVENNIFSLLTQLAEVSEGGVVCSAVLYVLSSCMAQLTVLQPLVTQEDQLLPTHVPLDCTDISSDLPDVVSSVLNVMYDIMEDEDLSGICFL